MMRLMAVLSVLAMAVSAASAAIAPREERVPRARVAVSKVIEARATPENEPYQMTKTTEVRLDGQPCRFEDVPADAEITLMEVSTDRRQILKVHFIRKRR